MFTPARTHTRTTALRYQSDRAFHFSPRAAPPTIIERPLSGCAIVPVAVKFHIAHLHEVQGKYRLAKEHYEALLKEKVLPPHLKADICRQLGKFLNAIANRLSTYPSTYIHLSNPSTPARSSLNGILLAVLSDEQVNR